MTLPQPPGHTTTPPHSPQGTPPEPTRPSTTTGPSTNGDQTKHPPTATSPSPPNKQPNPGMPPQHIQWIKPRGPQDVPVTMSNHIQLVPTAELITNSKSLLRNQF